MTRVVKVSREFPLEAGVYKRLQTRFEEVWGRRDITQPVSFRVPLYVKMLYDALDPELKRRVRLAVEQVILALAGLGEPPQPGQPVIINMNINMNENKPQVNVNVNMKELDEVKQLLEQLLQLTLASARLNRRAKQVLEQRVRRAQHILDKLSLN